MSTFILAVIIFGLASLIVCSRLKKGNGCEDCHTTCPVKKRGNNS